MSAPFDSSLDFGATLRGFAAGQKLFDRYTLVRILGRGGMGVVWLARDDRLEVDVALKFLPELLALDPGAIDDMKRETRRSRELSHRNIVKVYHFEQDNELAAIAMEHVDGASLAKLKVEQPGRCFSHTQLASWLTEVCHALDYAHSEAKMVHRDLKPANLMLDKNGRIKITDFGIASSIADSVSQLSAGRGSSGTPPYMSPQQASGTTATPADDIYSLGATIYDLLTGKPPFYSGNIHHQVENVVPPPMSERRASLGNSGATIPEIWEKAVAECLSKNPAERPRSASELAYTLGLNGHEAHRSIASVRSVAKPVSRPQSSRRDLLVGTLVIAIMTGTALVWWVTHRTSRSPAASPENATAPSAATSASPSPLRSDRGATRIITQPPGATVTLGNDTQETPALFTQLNVGAVTATINLEGYEPATQTFEVKGGEITNSGMVQLKRKDGAPLPPYESFEGAKLKTAQGEEVGRIEDVVNDNESQALYTIVSLNETRGKLIGVPRALFCTPANPEFVTIKVDKGKLRNAPQFDYSRWDECASAGWVDNLYSYYGLARKDTEPKPVFAKDQDVRLPIPLKPQLTKGDRGYTFEEHFNGYIDTTGKVAIDPKWEDATWFGAGRAAIKRDGKWGLIDRSGTLVVAPAWEKLKDFGSEIAVKRDGKWGFIDRTGAVVVELQWEWDETQPIYNQPSFSLTDGLIAVRRNGKWGFIDRAGKVVIEPAWDECQTFYYGLAAVRRDNKWGAINTHGEMVIEPQWERPCYFRGPLGEVERGDKKGLVDRNGKVVVPPDWEYINGPSDGLTVARRQVGEGYKTVFFDWTGKVVLEPAAGDVDMFHQGFARAERGHKYGYIDRSGKIVIDPKWDFAGDFAEGVAEVERGDKWGYINRSGRLVIEPHWDHASGFYSGLSQVEHAGRKGFIDHSGRVVIEPRWADIGPFGRDELAEVWDAGKAGYISRTGSVVIEPRFEYTQQRFAENGKRYIFAIRLLNPGSGDVSGQAFWFDSQGKELWHSPVESNAAAQMPSNADDPAANLPPEIKAILGTYSRWRISSDVQDHIDEMMGRPEAQMTIKLANDGRSISIDGYWRQSGGKMQTTEDCSFSGIFPIEQVKPVDAVLPVSGNFVHTMSVGKGGHLRDGSKFAKWSAPRATLRRVDRSDGHNIATQWKLEATLPAPNRRLFEEKLQFDYEKE